MQNSQGLSFSAQTLESTMQHLTVESAMRMLALAGSKSELETLIDRLARNFGADIPAHARQTIAIASKRWHIARKHKHVSYAHA